MMENGEIRPFLRVAGGDYEEERKDGIQSCFLDEASDRVASQT
jgi:hypothetical protein